MSDLLPHSDADWHDIASRDQLDADFPLGVEVKGQIECPLHAARFDIATGKCLSEIGQHDIHCYPVRVQAGRVAIQIPVVAAS